MKTIKRKISSKRRRVMRLKKTKVQRRRRFMNGGGKETKYKKKKKTPTTNKKYKTNNKAADIDYSAESFKKLNCAPKDAKSSDHVNDFSCFTNEKLINLRDIWNKRYWESSNQITSSDPKEIWMKLKQLNPTCSNESCWIKPFANELPSEIKDYTFSPESPDTWVKNPNEWLSSLEIEKVMKQYEHTYKCFHFMGPSPIDFDDYKVNGKCVWDEICNLGHVPHNLESLLTRGKTKIGLIFNTDPHTKGGSHWISLFINLVKGKEFIFYFDSTGAPIKKQVNELAQRVINQAKSIKNELGGPRELKLNINTMPHQKGSTECGMYSLYMLISLLTENSTVWNHDTFAKFMTERVPDGEMEKLRLKIFNVPGK
jgi:hypothetical protein